MISASPQTVHLLVSVSPKHHPPGTGSSRLWWRSSWSILSRTGSPALNGEAKAAPLITRSLKSLELSRRTCDLELKEAYCMLWLIVVPLNFRELHKTVGKYTDSEDGEFDKYINRVLGRLSEPKMQNSVNFRLKIADDDPAVRTN
uniref:Transferase, transferring glycosyl groups n=2 Tax=Solanum TaxID=4107 RepID=M1CL99_SOLTU